MRAHLKQALALAAALALPAFSDVARAQNADDVLLNFEGICLRNMHDVTIVADAVKVAGGTELPEDLRRGAAPVEGEPLGAWYLEADGLRLMIAAGTGQMRGQTVSTCNLAPKINNPDSVMDRMTELYKARPMRDDAEGFQRYLHFVLRLNGEELTITAMTGAHSDIADILNLAAQSGIPR